MPVAIGLLITSILHIFVGLNFFVYVYMRSAAAGGEPDPMNAYAMFSAVTMLYCLLLISGAFSMMRQGSYMWAVAVCVLALVPGFGPCYLLAIPFGIWGLLILRRPEVRDSFARY
jgi:hypothetical protein